MYQKDILPDENGNSMDVELYSDRLDFTAEWAGDIYGEGQLTLSTNQARLLLNFLKEHLEN